MYKEPYHQMPTTYVSQSTLKVFLNSPQDYYFSYLLEGGVSGGSGTATTSLGSLVHTLLLEPLEKDTRYLVLDEDERPEGDKTMASSKNRLWKQGMFQQASDESKELVSKSTMALGKAMVSTLQQHKTASSYFFPDNSWEVFTELAILWQLDPDGLPLKSKLDKVLVKVDGLVGEAIVVDYKTTSANNLVDFGWSVKKYGYDVQAAFYQDAAYYWLGEHYPGVEFTIKVLFVPQRTVAPFAVLGVIELDYQTLRNAQMRYQQGLVELQECLKTGNWENEGVTVLQLSKVVNIFPEPEELILPFEGLDSAL